jgi:hypothetical protein
MRVPSGTARRRGRTCRSWVSVLLTGAAGETWGRPVDTRSTIDPAVGLIDICRSDLVEADQAADGPGTATGPLGLHGRHDVRGVGHRAARPPATARRPDPPRSSSTPSPSSLCPPASTSSPACSADPAWDRGKSCAGPQSAGAAPVELCQHLANARLATSASRRAGR